MESFDLVEGQANQRIAGAQGVVDEGELMVAVRA